jgi:hypothetical protein
MRNARWFREFPEAPPVIEIPRSSAALFGTRLRLNSGRRSFDRHAKCRRPASTVPLVIGQDPDILSDLTVQNGTMVTNDPAGVATSIGQGGYTAALTLNADASWTNSAAVNVGDNAPGGGGSAGDLFLDGANATAVIIGGLNLGIGTSDIAGDEIDGVNSSLTENNVEGHVGYYGSGEVQQTAGTHTVNQNLLFAVFGGAYGGHDSRLAECRRRRLFVGRRHLADERRVGESDHRRPHHRVRHRVRRHRHLQSDRRLGCRKPSEQGRCCRDRRPSVVTPKDRPFTVPPGPHCRPTNRPGIIPDRRDPGKSPSGIFFVAHRALSPFDSVRLDGFGRVARTAFRRETCQTKGAGKCDSVVQHRFSPWQRSSLRVLSTPAPPITCRIQTEAGSGRCPMRYRAWMLAAPGETRFR